MARLAFCVIACLLALVCLADGSRLQDSSTSDWPQFRGPRRDDISTETGLLKQWPPDGPPLVWKVSGLGAGYSSLAVVGDAIYTMGDLADGCHVFALDRNKGTLRWSTKIGTFGGGGGYPGPRCTPTVDGDRVYALGQEGDLVCLETTQGKEIWHVSLHGPEFAGQAGGWGYAESPLVDGDHLICTPGGAGAALAALDKKTGALVWKSAVPGNSAAGYASIVATDIAGVRQYVQLLAEELVGVSAKDGKLLWQYGEGGERFGGNTANIPTPIVSGNRVFASAGYHRGGALLELSKSGQDFQVKEVYFRNALENKHGGVILVDGCLYGDTGDSGTPYCADFTTGKVTWKRTARTKGAGSASLTYADGHLYIRYDNGFVALVPATKEGYKEMGGFKIPNSESESWSHPVVAGGRLYLREKDMLWCYDIRQK